MDGGAKQAEQLLALLEAAGVDTSTLRDATGAALPADQLAELAALLAGAEAFAGAGSTADGDGIAVSGGKPAKGMAAGKGGGKGAKKK